MIRRCVEMWDLSLPVGEIATGIAPAASVLAAASINIHAVACHGPGAVCHLLVDDGPRCRDLLSTNAIAVSIRPVLVYTLHNRPGTLARLSTALSDAGVTLDFLYQATGIGLVVGAPDLEAVRRVMEAADAAGDQLGAGTGAVSAPVLAGPTEAAYLAKAPVA